MKLRTYERLIIETGDRYLYDIFGCQMVISMEELNYLENYLKAFDEPDESDESKMNDEKTKKMFDTIKEYLKKYKEVQVKYSKELN